MSSVTTDQGRSSTPPSPRKPEATGFGAILKPVFIPASVVIIGLMVLTVIFSRVVGDELEQATLRLNSLISDGVGWWYVIAVNVMLVFAVLCAVTSVGRIRLGRDDERPEFGMISWFLMLFSAGMGIGLVFFGVAEPLSHFVSPPGAFGNEPASAAAAQESVGLMMLQWGLHPWAIYSVVGLGLAYMSFRRGRPLAVRWLLEPLLGRKRIEGWIGHAIDTIAIVGTLFGIATSFGFGISQILGGFEFLGWTEGSNPLIIGLITVITGVAVLSVVSGVHKGLKWLSNINMSLAALLAVLVLLLGPTVFLLKSLPENLGMYLNLLPETALHVGAFSGDNWETAWTIGYWGWWTSWAPFVGMFIARISRGRTIREFVIGVLLAPTLASLVWFTVFGNSAILLQERVGTLATQDSDTDEWSVNSTTALFQFLDAFPGALPLILSVLAMIVVIFFFVTSSDSGSLVIDMLASGGNTNTPVATRVYWSVLEGVAAAVLLVVGGSVALTALQTLALSTAAPFSVILVLACFALYRAFRLDVAALPSYMQVLPTPQPDGLRHRLSSLRGLRNVSASLVGLGASTGAVRSEEAAEEALIAFRQVHPSDMVFDPETGVPRLAERDDPLAGEIFDTPEFVSSHEHARMQEGTGNAADDGQRLPDALHQPPR